VTLTREYDPYGNPIQGGTTSGHAFTGREWDAETGLYYYRARYYDPKIGRFLSEDPIGLLGGINLYAYVGNNPCNLKDPFGLEEYPDNFVGPLPPTGYYTSQMTKTACGLIPPAPAGVDIRGNMRQAASHVNPSWFYNQVRNKGPWDYKQVDPRYQDFGNFNYGATCRSFGFSERTCLREAGRGQQAAGTSQPNWGDPGWRINPRGGTPPYGDDPADAAWIQRGMDACKCLLSNP
jgi:RHS repeat-associated protein